VAPHERVPVGRLRADFGDVDASGLGLVPLPVEAERTGLVFVAPQARRLGAASARPRS
jgi:hypothetical protein